MTRSNARELAVHLIYGMDYTHQTAEEIVATRLEQEYYALLSQENDLYQERPNRKQLDYIKLCLTGVEERKPQLRATIGQLSSGWKVSRISRYTMAVLELALFEILFVDDVPDNVAASEAVNLCKKYEDQEVGAFVNGILGAFIRGGKVLKNAEASEEAALPTDEAVVE